MPKVRLAIISPRPICEVLAVTWLLAVSLPAWSDTITFSDDDFSLTPVFNDVTSFAFSIEVAGTLTAGSYINPTLTGIQYLVQGVLSEVTPSGFPGFLLERTIGGAEFYAQGSSLSFIIAAWADLSDGVQITEFAEFTFNGREVNTGRYHPPLLVFDQTGTGSIRNSDNSGGINPGSGEEVNVDFGAEYIVDLSFTPAVVPIPAAAWLFGSALGLLVWLRRKAA